MNAEQMKLLRDVAAMDKGNCICIAVLNLLDLVEKQLDNLPFRAP